MEITEEKGQDVEKRRAKLLLIKKTVGERYQKEGYDGARPLTFANIMEVFHLKSLWLVKGKDIQKFGETDHNQELEEYKKLKGVFNDLASLRIRRAGMFTHLIDSEGMICVFMTGVELDSNDVNLILDSIRDVQSGMRAPGANSAQGQNVGEGVVQQQNEQQNTSEQQQNEPGQQQAGQEGDQKPPWEQQNQEQNQGGQKL